MGTRTSGAPDLLPGTLEMLVLKALVRGPEHGFGIARRLKELSDEVLQVGEGSLYPALQRLLVNGLVRAEWSISDNKRRARYYALTAAGKKQLEVNTAAFERMVRAIGLFMQRA
jgi:PadR family transcriptional regulator, regulatory protein PadR